MRRLLERALACLCRHPSDRELQAYCDCELSGEDRRRVSSHLANCTQCADEVNFRRVASSLLEACAAPEPDASEISELRTALFASIDGEPEALIERDVINLLGDAARFGLGRPGRPVTPALEEQLAGFLGIRAAEQLKASWARAASGNAAR